MPADLLYFAPSDRATITPADIESLGLSYTLDDGLPSCRQTTGPGGVTGLIWSYKARTLYDASAQVWRAGPPGSDGKPRWHVGYWTAEKPSADDLIRKASYRGKAIKLQDGGEWIVPRCWCVLPEMPTTLSKLFDVDADGVTPLWRVHPRFEALSREAYAWWMEWSQQTSGEFDARRQAKLAADALSANYRIGLIEAMGLLALWSSDELTKILRAVIEADEVEAYFEKLTQKKTESPLAAPSTSSGVPAGIPPATATAPVSPT